MLLQSIIIFKGRKTMDIIYNSFGEYILKKCALKNKDIMDLMKETKIPLNTLKLYLNEGHEIPDRDFKKISIFISEDLKSLRVKESHINKYKRIKETK